MKLNARKIILTILGVVIVVDGIYLGMWLKDLYSDMSADKEVRKIVESNPTDSPYKMTKESFDELKNQYPNMIAYIEFPNDFLSEVVVQADDNEYYLTHWIDDTYSTQGSVYMDYSCNPTNQNITIYGHNVYYDATSRFSPLESLENQDAYDLHHEFKVWYEDHVSTYQISYVTIYDTYDDKDFDFRIKNFYTDEIYEEYLNWMNEHQMIQPIKESKLDKTSRIVTLQTCKKWHDTQRHVIAAKEVSSETY